jgi:hypothetical protein
MGHFVFLNKETMPNNITEVQILRGSSGSNAAYVGLPGVLTADLTSSAILGRGIVRLHDGTTPGGYIIGGVGGGGGGSGSTTYTNTSPVPTTLGGIVAGSTFVDVPLTTMFDQLLYPYQTPAFTAFTMSAQVTTLEVGDAITAGTKTFQWTTSNSTNVSASSISIFDWTNNTSVPIASSLANDGTEAVAVTAVTKTSATSHVYRISGSNSLNAGFSRDYTVNWRWRMYWGTASLASLTESQIEGLISSSLVTNSTGTFTFGTAGYKYLAYPTVFGLKTSFKDPSTGFDVDMQSAVTTAVSNSFGVGTFYYVHRTTNTLGGSISITVA